MGADFCGWFAVVVFVFVFLAPAHEAFEYEAEGVGAGCYHAAVLPGGCVAAYAAEVFYDLVELYAGAEA